MSGHDDLGLTLIFFYGKVKFAFWCFYDEMLEHKNSWKLVKILAYQFVYTVLLMSNEYLCTKDKGHSEI